MKSESEVAQSCPTLGDPMDCSPPGSSIRGIFQARVLEWGAIAFSVTCVKFSVNGGCIQVKHGNLTVTLRQRDPGYKFSVLLAGITSE